MKQNGPRKPELDHSSLRLVEARAELRRELARLERLLRRERLAGVKDKVQSAQATSIAAVMEQHQRRLSAELGLDTLEAGLDARRRAHRSRPRRSNSSRPYAGDWESKIVRADFERFFGPDLRPDDRARTGFLDRSTWDTMAVGFGVSNVPAYPLSDDQYSPFYTATTWFETDWVFLEDPAIMSFRFNVDFSNYQVSGWGNEEWPASGDDWSFLGVYYAVELKYWDGNSISDIGGTLTNVATSELFFGTNFYPHQRYDVKSHPPPGRIKDLELYYDRDYWDGTMLGSAGHAISARIGFVLYAQTYGDDAFARFDITRPPVDGLARVWPLNIYLDEP